MDTNQPPFLPVVEPENGDLPVPETAQPAPPAEEEDQDVYPVQQVAASEPVSEKEVKDAVRELNPDCNSLESR